MGSFGRLKRPISKHGFPKIGPISQFRPPSLWVSTKYERLKMKKSIKKKKLWIDQPCMLFEACVLRIMLLTQRKSYIAQMQIVFQKKKLPNINIVFSTICGTVTKNKNAPRSPFSVCGKKKKWAPRTRPSGTSSRRLLSQTQATIDYVKKMRNVLSSAPPRTPSQSRRRAPSMSGMNQLIKENAIKKTIELTASNRRHCHKKRGSCGGFVARMGVKTCSTIANS